MSNEALLGKTVPTELSYAGPDWESGNDIALCSSHPIPINGPFHANSSQHLDITPFKFLFFIPMYLLLASWGLAAAFRLEAIVQ
jgi:hypothetical protein